eukprot:1176586-Prorocentrum_minimum.AAC.2
MTSADCNLLLQPAPSWGGDLTTHPPLKKSPLGRVSRFCARAHQRLKMRTTRTGTTREGAEGPPPPPLRLSTCLVSSRRYSNANSTPAP